MFTVTPGSMVKVTPFSIRVFAVMMYGLLAFVQVVSELITPEISVDP